MDVKEILDDAWLEAEEAVYDAWRERGPFSELPDTDQSRGDFSRSDDYQLIQKWIMDQADKIKPEYKTFIRLKFGA